MYMNHETLKAYTELTRDADAWYKIWCEVTDKGQADLAEHCKWKLLQLIKDLDQIGDCDHKYQGINC